MRECNHSTGNCPCPRDDERWDETDADNEAYEAEDEAYAQLLYAFLLRATDGAEITDEPESEAA
jgi:hypothetical protein